MIAKPDLIKLVKYKKLDASALLIQKRYAASIYLAGYAVELALKYRICRTLRFRNGFPEDKNEFNTYRNSAQGLLWRNTITDIGQIKNHKLPSLLRYSGEQLNIENNLPIEWALLTNWNETLRYSVSIVRANSAKMFLSAAAIVVNELM